MSKLTGRKRYRVGFRKKVILQVEVSYSTLDYHTFESFCHRKWRDAKPEDLLEIEKK